MTAAGGRGAWSSSKEEWLSLVMICMSVPGLAEDSNAGFRNIFHHTRYLGVWAPWACGSALAISYDIVTSMAARQDDRQEPRASQGSKLADAQGRLRRMCTASVPVRYNCAAADTLRHGNASPGPHRDQSYIAIHKAQLHCYCNCLTCTAQEKFPGLPLSTEGLSYCLALEQENDRMHVQPVLQCIPGLCGTPAGFAGRWPRSWRGCCPAPAGSWLLMAGVRCLVTLTKELDTASFKACF